MCRDVFLICIACVDMVDSVAPWRGARMRLAASALVDVLDVILDCVLGLAVLQGSGPEASQSTAHLQQGQSNPPGFPQEGPI